MDTQRGEEAMSEDKMMRLAHQAGMVEWFNSDKTDYLTYKSAFLRFARLVAANQESLRLAAKGDRSPVAWVKLNNHGGIDLVLDDGLLDHQGRLALHCDLEGPIPLYTAA
jgi:hypothetical protein